LRGREDEVFRTESVVGDEETEEVAKVGKECGSGGRKFQWWIYTASLESVDSKRWRRKIREHTGSLSFR